MPDNRAANNSGSAKKRDKKTKSKNNNEKSLPTPPPAVSPLPPTPLSLSSTKNNDEVKNSNRNKQANETHKTKEQNNNVNNLTKLNLNKSKIGDDDEVIESKITGSDEVDVDVASAATLPDTAQTTNEEFDFDDTDLLELNDNAETTGDNNDNNTITGTTNDSNVNETTCQQPLSVNQPKNAAKSEHDLNAANCAVTTIATANANCDKQNELTKDNQNQNLVNSTLKNVNGQSKSKAPPLAALDLKNSPDVLLGNQAEDKYCPITPRRIVDIAELEDDETPNFVLRSSSSKALIGSKTSIMNESLSSSMKVNASGLSTAENSTAGDQVDNNDDGDYDYDDNDDEPDNELLVQFLGEANRIAEARLAARRQARAEAREIRMRELERQQKEQEQNADRVFDMHTASGIDPLSRSRLTAGLNSCSPVGGLLNSARGNSMSSRRSSEDSLEEEGRSLRDIRHELRDVEERFRKAMIANAQLDNERSSATYQIQLLKDKLEEMEEVYSQLQREFKEKSRDCNALKRNLDKLSEELKLVQGQLIERDTLIAEQGLVILTVENEDGSDAKRALVSCENAHLLGSVQGSLDVRLKKFSEEKQQLLTEVQQLQEQLDNHKSQGKGRGNSMNGPTGGDEEYEAQREANKIITEYKYKLQKAEQEIANLQASLQRSETQVIRYKSTAEAAEKAEAELKIERRKLQRENREAMERLEELETSNNHLLKRLDKLKNAKSALLKDL